VDQRLYSFLWGTKIPTASCQWGEIIVFSFKGLLVCRGMFIYHMKVVKWRMCILLCWFHLLITLHVRIDKLLCYPNDNNKTPEYVDWGASKWDAWVDIKVRQYCNLWLTIWRGGIWNFGIMPTRACSRVLMPLKSWIHFKDFRLSILIVRRVIYRYLNTLKTLMLFLINTYNCDV